MRINDKTPTWRVVLHGLLTLGTMAAFLIGLAHERWDVAAVFGLIWLTSAIDDARDRILDYLDQRDRPGARR